jgi:hypothetical protein
MKNSVHEQFHHNLSKCDICFHSFNRTDYTPAIICNMHHTVCKQCLEALHQQTLCPFCREPITPSLAVVNYYIYDLLPREQEQPNVRTQVEEQRPSNNDKYHHVEEESTKSIRLSSSHVLHLPLRVQRMSQKDSISQLFRGNSKVMVDWKPSTPDR